MVLLHLFFQLLLFALLFYTFSFISYSWFFLICSFSYRCCLSYFIHSLLFPTRGSSSFALSATVVVSLLFCTFLFYSLLLVFLHLFFQLPLLAFFILYIPSFLHLVFLHLLFQLPFLDLSYSVHSFFFFLILNSSSFALLATVIGSLSYFVHSFFLSYSWPFFICSISYCYWLSLILSIPFFFLTLTLSSFVL